MGIIGIVSALTLPNLNSSTGDKERVAKVKKIYRDLNDAFGRAVAVYGPYSTWFINDENTQAVRNKRTGERLTEFMKVSKECKQVANQGCFTSGNLKQIGGSDITNLHLENGSGWYSIITADGTSLAIVNYGTNIVVDIDGPNKGSYTYGKDLFWFRINAEKGIIPGREANADSRTFADILADLNPKVSSNKGESASAWIIRYDNMDYLKLDAEGKCPNGTTPTEANPRCK